MRRSITDAATAAWSTACRGGSRTFGTATTPTRLLRHGSRRRRARPDPAASTTASPGQDVKAPTSSTMWGPGATARSAPTTASFLNRRAARGGEGGLTLARRIRPWPRSTPSEEPALTSIGGACSQIRGGVLDATSMQPFLSRLVRYWSKEINGTLPGGRKKNFFNSRRRGGRGHRAAAPP